jgi:hypothetical protein
MTIMWWIGLIASVIVVATLGLTVWHLLSEQEWDER